MAKQKPKRSRPKSRSDLPQLGKLTPRHRFFLNPYIDARFTRCPQCDAPTKTRKKPFLVHVDPQNLAVLNMTGKYCPNCDLMILHKDKLEELLAHTFAQHDPALIGNDYLVLGTVERAYWRNQMRGNVQNQAVFDHLHDFIDYVRFEPQHYGWVPDPSKRQQK